MFLRKKVKLKGTQTSRDTPCEEVFDKPILKKLCSETQGQRFSCTWCRIITRIQSGFRKDEWGVLYQAT